MLGSRAGCKGEIGRVSVAPGGQEECVETSVDTPTPSLALCSAGVGLSYEKWDVDPDTQRLLHLRCGPKADSKPVGQPSIIGYRRCCWETSRV